VTLPDSNPRKRSKKIRRDAALICLRRGQIRLALTVLLVPAGWALEKH
jgi:hypothetical protein